MTTTKHLKRNVHSILYVVPGHYYHSPKILHPAHFPAVKYLPNNFSNANQFQATRLYLFISTSCKQITFITITITSTYEYFVTECDELHFGSKHDRLTYCWLPTVNG